MTAVLSCTLCTCRFDGHRQLETHFKAKHPDEMDKLPDVAESKKMVRSMRHVIATKWKAGLTKLERQHVKPTTDDKTKVVCTTCDESISKRRIGDHVCKCSGGRVRPADVKYWASFKDGHLLQRGKYLKGQKDHRNCVFEILYDYGDDEDSHQAVASPMDRAQDRPVDKTSMYDTGSWDDWWASGTSWEHSDTSWKHERPTDATWKHEDKQWSHGRSNEATWESQEATRKDSMWSKDESWWWHGSSWKDSGNYDEKQYEKAEERWTAGTAGEKTLKIKDAVRTYNPDDEPKPKGKNQFPHKVKIESLQAFVKYLMTSGTGTDDGTIRSHRYYVSALRSCFEYEDGSGEVDANTFFDQAVRQELVEEVISLPIWNEMRGWSRNAGSTFIKLTEHRKLEALKLRSEVGKSLAADMELVLTGVIRPWKKRCAVQANVRSHEKEDRDTERLEKVAPIGIIKTVLRHTMLRLKYLELAVTAGTVQATDKVRRLLNKLLVAIVFHGTYAGRPGEWKRMLMFDIYAMSLAEGGDKVISFSCLSYFLFVGDTFCTSKEDTADILTRWWRSGIKP